MISAKEAHTLTTRAREEEESTQRAHLLILAEQTIRAAVSKGSFSTHLEPFARFNTSCCGWVQALEALGYKVEIVGRGKSTAFDVSWRGAK